MRPTSGLRLAQVSRIERHDEARRAEAALRAMGIDHRLLHRVQLAVVAAQMLDGRDAAALEHRQQENAGVDGAVAHLAAAQLADHHGAGAAIAFRAPFLGARQPLGLAQIVEEGRGGRNVPQRLQPSIENERNAVAHDPRIHQRGIEPRTTSYGPPRTTRLLCDVPVWAPTVTHQTAKLEAALPSSQRIFCARASIRPIAQDAAELNPARRDWAKNRQRVPPASARVATAGSANGCLDTA